MARKPPVLLKMRVSARTRSLVVGFDRKLNTPPAEFIGRVVDLYGVLMDGWRAGAHFSAVSSDRTVCIPDLLLAKLIHQRRVPLVVRTPRTLRKRCHQLARWSGTDDVGMMFEKAISIYGSCVTLNRGGGEFYCRPEGHQPVPIKLEIT
jgi:hypothetical protein